MLIACFFGMMGVMPISNFPCLACKQPRRQHGARRRAVFDGRFELPSALVFGPLQKKMSSAKILLISIIFMVVKPLLILASGSPGMLLAVQPVQMLGYGLFFPASVYFANESVDPADRVQGQSIRTISPSRSVRCWAVSFRVSDRSRHNAHALVLDRLRVHRRADRARRAGRAEKSLRV
ncbi:MAG: MFS transporter [Acutalibacteraceae bacterium]